MSRDFVHVPVLMDGVLKALGPSEGRRRVVVDGTMGGAGHSRALLQADPHLELIAIDRDPDAIAVGRERLGEFGDRVRIHHGAFAQVQDILDGEKVDGLLVDLGVSSFQLDTAERGFSFRRAGPLDMRMDPTTSDDLGQILGDVSVGELARIIRTLGEERFAKRVAAAILKHKPQDTDALAEVVRGVVPASRDGIDPATRTFQALRMWVNDELGQLEQLLSALPQVLQDHGVAAVISFHSLEDRLVKRAFREGAQDCICPPKFPVCRCNHRAVFKVLTPKPVVATPQERADNARSRSAKLRAARRLPRDPESQGTGTTAGSMGAPYGS